MKAYLDKNTENEASTPPSELSNRDEKRMELLAGVKEVYQVVNPHRNFWARTQEKSDYQLSSNDYYNKMQQGAVSQEEEQALEDEAKNSFSTMPSPQYKVRRVRRMLGEDAFKLILKLPDVERMNAIDKYSQATSREFLQTKAQDKDDYDNYYPVPWKKPKLVPLDSLAQRNSPKPLNSGANTVQANAGGDPSELRDSQENKMQNQSKLDVDQAPQLSRNNQSLNRGENSPMNAYAYRSRDDISQDRQETIVDYYRQAKEKVSGVYQDIGNTSRDLYHTVGEHADEIFHGVHQKASQAYQDVGTAVGDASNKAVASLSDGLSSIGLKDTAGSINESYQSSARMLGDRYHDIGEYASHQYKQAGEQIEGYYQDAGAIAEQVYTGVGDAAEIADGVVRISRENREKIDDIVDYLIEDANKTYKETSDILCNGISSIVLDPDNADDKMQDMMEDVIHLGKGKYNAFKSRFGDDVKELSEAPIDWIQKNRNHFEDAQELFDMPYVELRAVGLAIAEEMNRNQNLLNNLGNYIQDSIIEKFGIVLSSEGILREDIGPGNIFTGTAEDIVNLLKIHPKANTPEMQEIINECSNDEGLARYLLTDRGTIMIGAAVMVREAQKLKPYLSKVKDPDDYSQHLANFWREGENRITRMKNKMEQNEDAGKTYIPEHGYENKENPEKAIHRQNLNKLDKALNIDQNFRNHQ